MTKTDKKEKKEKAVESKKEKVSKGFLKSKMIIVKVVIAIFVVLGLFIGSVFGLEYYYQDKVYPGISLHGESLNGKLLASVDELVESTYTKWDSQDLKFTIVDSNSNKIDSINIKNEFITYNKSDLIEVIKLSGRSSSFLDNIKAIITGYFRKADIAAAGNFNKGALQVAVMNILSESTPLAKDATFKVTMKDKISYDIEIIKEQEGFSYDFEKAYEALESNIRNNTITSVELVKVKESPKLLFEQAKLMSEQVKDIILRGDIDLFTEDDRFADTKNKVSWMVGAKEYGNWLELVYINDESKILFKKELALEYLKKHIEPAINRDPVNAVFEMGTTKVKSFITSQNGRDLQSDATVDLINNTFFVDQKNEIALVVNQTEPEITTESSNDLGLKEIIGIGTSTYPGSPVNRRHNIAIGADAVNGTLLAPGEEFSMLGVLGNIDAAGGYRQELVIKGDRTIPEYGGGLCQIGTTAFRGALDAGLEITQRRNHSYRVAYYEPAGTDATIYDPAPDFRFRNDTANHVLILTFINGSELTYEFWGTSDGRKIDVGEPRIYGIVAPPPAKLIETTDLPPGVKKCTERAHNGAQADLSRTIVYADGREDTQSWHSYYKPWQEVCLIGVESLAVPLDDADSDVVVEEGSAVVESE